jgi:hypothetical protein
MSITIILVLGVTAVTAALVGFAYLLAEFALASRTDNPYAPARNGSTRRARFITGMYTRGDGWTTQSLVAAGHDTRLRAVHDESRALHEESLSVGELRAYRAERLIGDRDGELVA